MPQINATQQSVATDVQRQNDAQLGEARLSPSIDSTAFTPFFQAKVGKLVCKNRPMTTSPADWDWIKDLVKSNDNGLGSFTLNIFALVWRLFSWLGLSKTVNQLAETAIRESVPDKEQQESLVQQFKEINSKDGRLARMILAITDKANGTGGFSTKELIETFHTLITRPGEYHSQDMATLLGKWPLDLLNRLQNDVLSAPPGTSLSQKSTVVTAFRNELDSEIAKKSAPPSPAPIENSPPLPIGIATGAGHEAETSPAGQEQPQEQQPPLPPPPPPSPAPAEEETTGAEEELQPHPSVVNERVTQGEQPPPPPPQENLPTPSTSSTATGASQDAETPPARQESPPPPPPAPPAVGRTDGSHDAQPPEAQAGDNDSDYLPSLEGDDYHQNPSPPEAFPTLPRSRTPPPNERSTAWHAMSGETRRTIAQTPPPPSRQTAPPRRPAPPPPPPSEPPRPKTPKGPSYTDVATGKAKPQAEAEGWHEAKGRRSFRPQGPKQTPANVAGIPASRNIYDVLPMEEGPAERPTPPPPPPAPATPPPPAPRGEDEWKVVGEGRKRKPTPPTTPRPPTSSNPFDALRVQEEEQPEEARPPAAPPEERKVEPTEPKPSKRQEVRNRRLARQAKEKEERAWRRTVQDAFGDMQGPNEIFAERSPRPPPPPPPAREEPAVPPLLPPLPPPPPQEPPPAIRPTGAPARDYTGLGLEEDEMGGDFIVKSYFMNRISEALRINDNDAIKAAILRHPSWVAEAMDEAETLPSGLKSTAKFSMYLGTFLSVFEQPIDPRVAQAISRIIEAKINECKDLKESDPEHMRMWQDIQAGAFGEWMRIRESRSR